MHALPTSIPIVIRTSSTHFFYLHYLCLFIFTLLFYHTQYFYFFISCFFLHFFADTDKFNNIFLIMFFHKKSAVTFTATTLFVLFLFLSHFVIDISCQNESFLCRVYFSLSIFGTFCIKYSFIF